MHKISPSSAAMTSSSPGTPGPMNTSQTGQQARTVPPTSMTRRRPNRSTARRESREPIRPPRHGTAKASPYCQGRKCSRPSMSTASSGSVAMISPLKNTLYQNWRRRVAWPRM